MCEAETYPMPRHGWTCFHCGDTFTTPGAARQHFGFDPSYEPACRIKVGEERGLVRALRKVESKYRELLEKTCDEQGAVAQEFYGLGARHAGELLRAEERGYAKGLAEGMAQPTESLGQRLRRLRTARRMTMAHLARPLGVSKPTIHAWEHDRACPVENRMAGIAAALGVPENYLRHG